MMRSYAFLRVVHEAIMRVYKIISFSGAIVLIAVLFAGVATVPAAAQYDTKQFRYNAQHAGNYSPVAGSNVSNGNLSQARLNER